MPGITVPTLRQLSNPIPLTKPGSFHRRVGITRIFSKESLRPLDFRKVLQKLDPGAPALLRVELHAENIIVSDRRHESAAIGGRGQDGLRLARDEMVAVNKVEIRAVR